MIQITKSDIDKFDDDTLLKIEACISDIIEKEKQKFSWDTTLKRELMMTHLGKTKYFRYIYDELALSVLTFFTTLININDTKRKTDVMQTFNSIITDKELTVLGNKIRDKINALTVQLSAENLTKTIMKAGK